MTRYIGVELVKDYGWHSGGKWWIPSKVTAAIPVTYFHPMSYDFSVEPRSVHSHSLMVRILINEAVEEISELGGLL